MFINELFVVVILIPISTKQHFIWPLNQCLLADICNHTWIPECGQERTDLSRRMFIDECDMYEFNCDNQKLYDVVNYTDCFMLPVTGCPTFPPCPANPTCPHRKYQRIGPYVYITNEKGVVAPPLPTPPLPCPSFPPCPNHKYHKMGQRYVFITNPRRVAEPPSPPVSLPMHMLSGKRRYTPQPWKKRIARTTSRRTRYIPKRTKTIYISKKQPIKTQIISKTKISSVETVILKRVSVIKNGRTMIKVIKGVARSKTKATKDESDDDFLE